MTTISFFTKKLNFVLLNKLPQDQKCVSPEANGALHLWINNLHPSQQKRLIISRPEVHCTLCTIELD
jgi:hypothetical protein